MTNPTYYISSEVNPSPTYINDRNLYRFFGITRDNKLIHGTQSGIQGNKIDVVRFDETLDVEIYEAIGTDLIHCPNLKSTWS